MNLPTAESVIRDGGWDPRYARVLVVAGTASVAVALVDTNGDGGAVEQCFFVRADGDVWREGPSSGFVSTAHGSVSHGETLGHVVAVGRAEAPGPVTTVVGGTELHAEANDEGWWAVVGPRPDTV